MCCWGFRTSTMLIRLDAFGGYFPFALFFDDQQSRALAMHLEANFLEVQDDIGHIFEDPGNGRKLVQNAINFDTGDGRALERRKEDPPQGIAQSDAEAPFQRFTLEFAVGVWPALVVYFQALGFD